MVRVVTDMLRHLCIACACLLAMGHSSIAQISEERSREALRGLTSIAVLVDGLDEEAARCGITQALIRDAFMFPASQTKIEVRDNAASPGWMFYVRVVVLIQERPNQCISYLEFAVHNLQKISLDHYSQRSAVWASVRVWDYGSMRVGKDHPQQVRTAIENATKKFLAIWNEANKG